MNRPMSSFPLFNCYALWKQGKMIYQCKGNFISRSFSSPPSFTGVPTILLWEQVPLKAETCKRMRPLTFVSMDAEFILFVILYGT